MSSSLACPTCGKTVQLTPPASRPDAAESDKSSAVTSFLPFCSQRCKMVDLGAWADGEYAVSRPLSYDDIDEADVDERRMLGL